MKSTRTFLVLFLLFSASPSIAAAPAEALKQFQLADGFEISLVAAEPDIRQPVAINFDDRGRLWVVQYLQYPNPAGLKKLQVDQYMRTRFDRVPPPPPRGPRGADRITICEDTNGDGRADKFRDFVAGLNMATGLCHGYGGVFVAQSPYLLFYPDRNRDDVPDGEPEVLVSGFGMEDSHAYPNSLQIGPDGWLYGAQGSNVWARVEVTLGPHGETIAAPYREQTADNPHASPKDKPQSADSTKDNRKYLEFNQCVWRYHPPTHRLEIFAEGGGNTWGVDFDRRGEIIAGTNFGGVCGLHMVQGGYYVKGFAKHGPLSNPYAFGYFEHMPYASPQRISQGEHVMCGGIVYQGGAFGDQLENQYITCALLHRNIYWHRLEADRSTYKADFGGSLVATPDLEFRPVDLALAPDASVYIADWTDVRANHVIPEDTWNKTNGRIYRLARRSMPRAAPFDLSQHSPADLAKLLDHSNAWQRREAIRHLADRRDEPAVKAIGDQLESSLFENAMQPNALAKYWAMSQITGLPSKTTGRMLGSSNPEILAWTIRLIGDQPWKWPEHLDEVSDRVDSKHVLVRRQLASTAGRLPFKHSFPVVIGLSKDERNAADPFIPLLTWWATESIITREDTVGTTFTLQFLGDAPWTNPLLRDVIAPRLAERYTADPRESFSDSAAALMMLAPTPADIDRIALAANRGFVGKRDLNLSSHWKALFDKQWRSGNPSPAVIQLALHFKFPAAHVEAQKLLADNAQPALLRIQLIESLCQTSDAVPASELLSILDSNQPQPLQTAALQALARSDDAANAKQLLALYPKLSKELRDQALAMLASRKSTAHLLLEAVAAKTISTKEITNDLAQAIDQHADAQLTDLLAKTIGRFGAQTTAEKQQQIDRFAALLASNKESTSAGKPLFAKHCGICHTLNGEGNKIGPDLTGADRGNRPLMLASIVDPSLGIRHEYAASVLRTTSGQVLTGLITAETPASITLVDAKNIQHTIARDEVDELKASTQSLMPEKLLDALSETEVRSLFAYLEAGAPQSTPPGSKRTFTFDRTTEGWTLIENGKRTQTEHLSRSGNGALLVRDADAAAMTLVAPPSMLGDHVRLVDGMAWIDVELIEPVLTAAAADAAKPSPAGSFGKLTLESGKLSMQQMLFHPTIGTPRRESTRYSARLTAEAFSVDAAKFREILKNVTRITITIDPLAANDESIAIDNITLQPK